MSTELPPPAEEPRPSQSRRRSRWRLRALLAVNALAFALYGFVQLERPAAEKFGPLGESVHDLFHADPSRGPALSRAARRFKNDVESLGGNANVWVRNPGLLGYFGRSEWYNVDIRNPRFDDDAFAKVADRYGDQIGGLDLQATGLTDAGLSHLSSLTALRHLHIRDDSRKRRSRMPARPSAITDAGLVHLAELPQLESLHLSGLAITDASLEAITDLPSLQSLYLFDTRIQGRALANLKSLPKLSILYLDGSPIAEENLAALAGARGLQILSLNRVPLTTGAFPFLRAIPGLTRLELTGCGLLDEEADALASSMPGVRIVRE